MIHFELPVVYIADMEQAELSSKLNIDIQLDEVVRLTAFFVSPFTDIVTNSTEDDSYTMVALIGAKGEEHFLIKADYETIKNTINKSVKEYLNNVGYPRYKVSQGDSIKQKQEEN